MASDYEIKILFRAESDRDAWRMWARFRDQLEVFEDDWRWMDLSRPSPVVVRMPQKDSPPEGPAASASEDPA